MDPDEWASSGVSAEMLRTLVDELSPTRLQSLLLAVSRARAAKVSTARVLQRWRDDAFVLPSDVDARKLSAVESVLWQSLPDDVVGLELSPVAPFGACAAVAGTHQNRVLTTTRTSEVVSDQTVVLALAAADRRRRQPSDPVHLAASHRILRTQRFQAPYRQHFRLFALVSSARDAGSRRTESTLLTRHLRFYVSALSSLVPDLAIRLRVARFTDVPVPELSPLPPNVDVLDDSKRTRGRRYYRDLAIGIDVIHDGEEIEIGDGGFTDWTAKLLSDDKERCLTSCVSVERLASLRAAIRG